VQWYQWLLCAGIYSHRLIQALSSGITYRVLTGSGGCSHWYRWYSLDPVLSGSGSQLRHHVPGTHWIRCSVDQALTGTVDASLDQAQASLQAVLQAVQWYQWYSGRVVDQVPGTHWLRLRLRFRLCSGTSGCFVPGSIATGLSRLSAQASRTRYSVDPAQALLQALQWYQWLLCAGIYSHRLIQALSSGITYQVLSGSGASLAQALSSGTRYQVLTGSGSHWYRWYSGRVVEQVPGTHWIRLRLRFRLCSGTSGCFVPGSIATGLSRLSAQAPGTRY
jgi:hypothetical protein